MSSVHETAYPRFKTDLTQRELEDIYNPTEEEFRLSRRLGKDVPARLYLLVLLKTVQRLGYFVMLADVPPAILTFLTKSIGARTVSTRELLTHEKSNTRQRFMDAIRVHLRIKPISKETDVAILNAAENAAQTKQDLADIVNVIIEELIRQRFELPAFSGINRTAQRVRNQVNENYFRTLSEPLPHEVIVQFDAMLIPHPVHQISGWQQLKREPKKPTNTEIKYYLEHVKWLKSWAGQLPIVSHIPIVKYHQYVDEARALDATDLRTMKPSKRYGLMVVLFHAQLGKALDDAVDMFVRKLRKIHSGAEEQLRDYYLEHQKRAEKLVSQLRDVLEAFQEGDNDQERGSKIAAAIHESPELLIAECEEHMAYAGNNFLPFLLNPYQTQRPLLLNCIELLNLESSTADNSLIDG